MIIDAEAQDREDIQIVGSSTVFPFSSAVAQEFGRKTGYRSPTVEATGSGGGISRFCDGLGFSFPDIANSSRRIKQSEYDRCVRNGVGDIIELKIGYDGIVLANATQAARYDLRLRDIYLALAKDIPDGSGAVGAVKPNPYTNWSEIDPRYPDAKIEVLGPPGTSGTRDAFNELGIEAGCNTFPEMKALKSQDKKRHRSLCRIIRNDGDYYIPEGENDNLIIQKLKKDYGRLGVFGFSFLRQNSHVIAGAPIDGVAPTFENISDKSYPIARALYIYIKRGHMDAVPGLREFLLSFTQEKAWGPTGYLADKGLIPMKREERDYYAQVARDLTPLRLDDGDS
ncbi:MAG: substrate-binding domain-containing protein [Pseudomonadota bacterium]